jgi:ribonuclease HI
MIVFMDGSGQQTPNAFKRWTLSWGLVAHHNDTTVELHGGTADAPQQFCGFHEMMAFAEAVNYVKRSKVPYCDVSFFTDDEWVVNAAFALHKDNWVSTETVDGIHNRLMMFVNEFYPSVMYDDMVECLRQARFTKVKGHEDTVYNLRVDYLAAHARNLAHGAKEEFLNFEQWLAKGFRYFNLKTHEWDVWYAPFAHH